MKIDILAYGAHPDDVELSASGTLAKHKALGLSIGIIDLTRGELGTRGTAETRDKEAADSAKILNLDVRENLELRDGFFQIDEETLLKVITSIRKYQPDIILCNAIRDRHPDHGRGGELLSQACFLSGLRRIETFDKGNAQEPWRPSKLLHYVQNDFISPDIIVDISDFWAIKEASIRAFATQFHNPASNEPETFISRPEFFNAIESRSVEMGHAIGKKYGEGFTADRKLGINNLQHLI